jgi:hypothetical protein
MQSLLALFRPMPSPEYAIASEKAAETQQAAVSPLKNVYRQGSHAQRWPLSERVGQGMAAASDRVDDTWLFLLFGLQQ